MPRPRSVAVVRGNLGDNMATIRFESVVTSQTASQTLGYYKVYVTGNPESADGNGIVPILTLRQLKGTADATWKYPYNYPASYVYTYRSESELFLYPADKTCYFTSSVGTYNLEEYGVAWEEGILADLATSMYNKYNNYYLMGSTLGNYRDIYAKGFFTNFYVYSTATPLSTPIGLNATNITSDSALVSWAQNANASNFKIEYKINGDTSWTQTTSD